MKFSFQLGLDNATSYSLHYPVGVSLILVDGDDITHVVKERGKYFTRENRMCHVGLGEKLATVCRSIFPSYEGVKYRVIFLSAENFPNNIFCDGDTTSNVCIYCYVCKSYLKVRSLRSFSLYKQTVIIFPI